MEKIENTADGHQWHITEKEAKSAGLSLIKDDGRYVFQGKTVTLAEARALLKFAQKEKRPAHSLGEAMDGTAI